MRSSENILNSVPKYYDNSNHNNNIQTLYSIAPKLLSLFLSRISINSLIWISDVNYHNSRHTVYLSVYCCLVHVVQLLVGWSCVFVLDVANKKGCLVNMATLLYVIVKGMSCGIFRAVLYLVCGLGFAFINKGHNGTFSVQCA